MTLHEIPQNVTISANLGIESRLFHPFEIKSFEYEYSHSNSPIAGKDNVLPLCDPGQSESRRAVTELDLSYNNIEGIDVTSLAAFEYLSSLIIQYNSIRYIEEGAFDNNRFLSLLRLSYNSIEMMPSFFGAAKNSLLTIQMWDALTAKAVPQANFSECIKLEYLNIGSNPYYILNVSILPHNPTQLAFHYMEL